MPQTCATARPQLAKVDTAFQAHPLVNRLNLCLAGKSPAALAARIMQVAAMLGAPFQTPDALRKAAEQQVDEIVARVRVSGQSGALKKWNARYRQYRLAQVEKREPAIP